LSRLTKGKRRFRGKLSNLRTEATPSRNTRDGEGESTTLARKERKSSSHLSGTSAIGVFSRRASTSGWITLIVSIKIETTGVPERGWGSTEATNDSIERSRPARECKDIQRET